MDGWELRGSFLRDATAAHWHDYYCDTTGQGSAILSAAVPAPDDLDYVGLDFFPDVFRPVARGRVAAVTEAVLREHRENVLAPAGLSAIPLRITENGWPTGPGRSPERQAEVIEAVVTAAAQNADPLGLTGYTHFSLRDADSANPGLFHQFGLMTDDYTPKPAFHACRDLISRFSA